MGLRVRPSQKERAPVIKIAASFTLPRTSQKRTASSFTRSPVASVYRAIEVVPIHQAADLLVAEPAPGPDAGPGHVLHRVAEVRHLPVEYALDFALAECRGSCPCGSPRGRARRVGQAVAGCAAAIETPRARPAAVPGRRDRPRPPTSRSPSTAQSLSLVGSAEELQASGAPVESVDARQDTDELARPADRAPERSAGPSSTFVGLVSQPSMRSITKNGRSSQAPSVSSQCMRGTGTPCAATASITRNSTSRSVTSRLASGSRRKMNPRLTSRPLSCHSGVDRPGLARGAAREFGTDSRPPRRARRA